MPFPVPRRCRWCDRVLHQLRGWLVCPRCDMRQGEQQKGVS